MCLFFFEDQPRRVSASSSRSVSACSEALFRDPAGGAGCARPQTPILMKLSLKSVNSLTYVNLHSCP